MKPPPEETWQQKWNPQELETIGKIADELRNEQPMDDASLWMSAENEFSTGIYGQLV
jgi:hypothetical protein